MIASNGGVFSFGDANYFGSVSVLPLANPVVGMAATPNGEGYWIVDQTGDVFAEGNAKNQGSPAGLITGQQVVSITSSG
jgi:hypothetical protein